MRSRHSPILLLIIAAMYAGPAVAETIAIIGTGNVASALGPEFAAQGHASRKAAMRERSSRKPETMRRLRHPLNQSKKQTSSCLLFRARGSRKS